VVTDIPLILSAFSFIKEIFICCLFEVFICYHYIWVRPTFNRHNTYESVVIPMASGFYKQSCSTESLVHKGKGYLEITYPRYVCNALALIVWTKFVDK
jgi:hypothetical protein